MRPAKKSSTRSIRYIGSKARVTGEILAHAGMPTGGRFVDLFCGTGVVSREAALRGWPILANDSLLCAATLTEARLIGEREVAFQFFGGYWKAIEALNGAPPQAGFITREYSPASKKYGGFERRYYTVENASRIDGFRLCIEEWFKQGSLTSVEKVLLLADLIEAANAVANIAGTYGCFMRSWTQVSQNTLALQPRILLPFNASREIRVGDALRATCLPDDLVYLDPPYTKRQYAAYYHLIETIAAGDEPIVQGTCGLRPWEHLASPFCYKRRALDAMVDLVRRLPAGRILISYSNEGHIRLDELRAKLYHLGDVVIHELREVGRYRPNTAASANGGSVCEYLVDFRRFGYEKISIDAVMRKGRQHEFSL